MVLKITDNTTCLKFKTYSSVFLNRFEALNLSLMQKMQNHRPMQLPGGVAKPEHAELASQEVASPAAVPGTAGPAGGGGVKKKKPKKKK